MASGRRPPAVLCLALALLSAPAAAGSRTVVHTVEPGQTLWSIAHRYRVTVEDLIAVNRLDDQTELEPGTRLVIPEARPRRDLAEAGDGPLDLVWPLRGTITSGFGRRRRSLHAGLDIAATPGTIIVAAAPGKVVRAGRRWGRYGTVVLIEHRHGYTTLYAHAARTFVREGQSVRQGDAIAAVGRTGNATGPHLHFEVWAADRAIDPLRLLEPPALAMTLRR